MALPEDHLAKFHKMTDAKEMWDAIKSRFGGNDESKKIQKYILKQQFEGFSVSNSEGLHKGYDSSTNDVSTAYSVSNPSGQNSQYEQTSSYSLLANQSSCPQLDHEDLEQLDEYDLEEMDLKWQVAMISMRMKKFYKKTGRKLQFDAKEPVGFDKTKVECYNCHKTGHFARECRTKGNQDSRRRDAWNSGNKDGRRSGKQEDSKALVTIDGEGVNWTRHSEEEEDYALMACNSSGSDTEVTSCSNECKESYAKLKKLYDAQREQLSDASIEIKAYTQGLKKVEAQLVAHQQGQLWYEEKIRFMKIDLDDKTDVLTYHKKLLAEAQKEKEDLKAKVEKWHTSSKNLGKLLNTQMSANDKFGIGYGDHIYDGILSYENEVLQSVFMNKESELEKQHLYDRFVIAGGMHVVPPPMTGNYMPTGPDIEVDYSQFTYGPKQTQPSESETQTSEIDTCESNISTEPPELVSEPVVNESNVESQPKVWSDAPIIEEYESDSEDEYVSLPTKEQETPSFANQQVKTPRETVKNHFTHNCDFHEKRMAKQAVLNNRMKRNSSQREIRPIWNNVQRVNHQNQFVPTAVLTRTGKIPVNTARASGTKNVSTARHSFNRQAVLTSVAMKVNTVKPIVNRVRPTTVFHKTHSPLSKPFNKTTALRTNFSKQKVNTAKVNAVSAVGGKRETADYPHRTLKHKGIIDSGCSKHMTRNKATLLHIKTLMVALLLLDEVKGTRVSSFDLEAYSDSDYARANLDRKSTTGGCQFLGRRLISWQCKKQTIVATSTTEAEYVAAANCCGVQCAEAFLTISDEFQEVNWVFKSHWEEIKTTDGMQSFMRLLIFLREAPFIMLSLYITAKVAGKPVSISEASIRSDLLFDDADRIDSLSNQAIFDVIQLMGYEGDLTVLTFNKDLFSPQWRQLVNVPVPLDHFSVNSLTSKVFSFMVKKGVFEPHLHPLLSPMKANIEPQSDPSHRPSPIPHILDSISEVSGGNHGGQSSSDKSLSGNKGDMTLQSVYDLYGRKGILKSKNWMQKESVSKQERKSAKAEPSVHKDPLFNELDDDEIDNMDTKDAQVVRRTRNGVNAEK
ncbi:ribonuclease H-like domain-containing protein [Tanacetum coccineum]